MDYSMPGFAVHHQLLELAQIHVHRVGDAIASWTLSVAVHAQDFLKKVAIIREGTQPHPSTEDWIKDLLSMALPIRTRPSFPYSQSLPSGSFDKPLT